MSEMPLRALDGANPLGFLAAVGAVRLCDLLWPGGEVRMRWMREARWVPALSGIPAESEEELCAALAERAPWAPLDAFDRLGKNLTVSREEFGETARRVVRQMGSSDRAAADFLAAFGNEVYEEEKKGRITYTDLCFITGSGHQDFLGSASALARAAGAAHLRAALFLPWRRTDKGNSFRWDPEDAKEYALRWRDPSIGGASTVWGANRLAFEALPFYPTVPAGSTLRTTAFNTNAGAHEFTWPIWIQAASADSIRSLVGMRPLQEPTPDREALSAMGVAEVFRAQRVRIGQGANFKVSFRPARAV